MEQYISKDALVAEIKKRKAINEKSYMQAFLNSNDNRDSFGYKVQEDIDILSSIDTIEVKEVDLDKELDKFYGMYRKNGQTFSLEDNEECVDWKVDCNPKFEKSFAKYFFELGLKAQHDNWKVVDNTNPPQADRNKIYCVFTKNRYILATVINHPKDEELLQWKCTEFPHHCYDMCEGDKYMQII